jgi:hypothetical protein
MRIATFVGEIHRAGTSYQDQIFLLRRGLLQHITASLIQTDSR